MLPVIQQYISLLERVCVNPLLGGELQNQIESSNNIEAIIKANKEKIAQHLQDMDVAGHDSSRGGLISEADGKLSGHDYTVRQSSNEKILKALDIYDDVLSDGVDMNVIVEKLDQYVGEKDTVIDTAIIEKKQLQAELIDTSVFTRTLKEGRTGKDVAELNKFLSSVTSYTLSDLEGEEFSFLTKTALKKFQEANGLVSDGIAGKKTYATIIKQLQFVEKTDTTIVAGESLGEKEDLRHNDVSQVSEQIDTAQKSMTRTSDMLTATPLINSVLSERGFHENRGFSIEKGIRELLGTDSYESILGRKKDFEGKIEGIDSDKLKSAITFLTHQPEEVYASEGDMEQNPDFEEVLDFVIKVFPWLYGVYLGDLPLPFIKNGMKGADIDKAKAFQDWINEGGTQEFKEYYKNNKNNYEVDIIEQQYTLQNIFATLQITDATSTTEIQQKMATLSATEEKLLIKYIEIRLIPDLKIMRLESFNFFERWLFDKKASKTSKIIQEMEKSETDGATDLELAQQVLELLKEEDDASMRKHVATETNRTDYMLQVQENQEILDTMSDLIGVQNNNLNILFLTEDINHFCNVFGVPANLKQHLITIKNGIENNQIDFLEGFLAQVPHIKEFFATVGTKEYVQFRLKNMNAELGFLREEKGISNEYTQAFDRSGTPINSQKYGGHIDGMSGPEALEQILTTYPENPNQTTFDLLYKGVIEKSERNGFSASDLYNTIEGGSMVLISELEGALINTGRETNMDTKVTSFAELASERGDTEIFKGKPIIKEYSYVTEDGQKVVETVEYNTYLRPDCSNLLIVPESVMTTVDGIENPEFPMATLTSYDGYVPIAVAWDIVNGSNGSSGGGGEGSGDISTTTTTNGSGASGNVGGVVPNGSNNVTNTVTGGGFIPGG